MLTPMQKTHSSHAFSVRRFLSRFARDEDGALIIFGVYVFLIILMVGGIGIDLMRFERDRANLQYTLDRAVLAAADLDQDLVPSEVVQDYFDKADLSEHLTSVTVTSGLGYRIVTGDASAQVKTQFMHMTGIDTLTAPAKSTAEERIDGVEISMVLDVSGSMNDSNRLTNLKAAATSFVDILLGSAAPGDVSISLVPYASQVAVGATILDHYNYSREHTNSFCVNFLADEYNNPSIPPEELLLQTVHFDPFGDVEINVEAGETLANPVCPTRPEVEILPLSMDATILKAHIDGLTAKGNTSIDLGMKWGVALLDPVTQPVVSELVADGDIPGPFADRPVPYNTHNTMKVIVLMTDGENSEQFYMLPPYRDDMSDIWRNPETGNYSVLHGGHYYFPHDGTWNTKPHGDAGAVRLNYMELWERGGLRWNALHNYADIMGSTTAALAQWQDGVPEVKNREYKDARLKTICDVVKGSGVIIFTVGFESPRRGVPTLKGCASSASHYFDVYGPEIVDAFSAIASSIRKLRLTQ